MKSFIISFMVMTMTSLCFAADYTNPVGMEFNHIQAGSFIMGSPIDEVGRNRDEGQHKVTLTSDFFMQTTEVTQGQWIDVMGSNPSFFYNCGSDCPVERVSWYDVQDFIEKLNRQGHGTYALPTEAQWEYAARAGSETAYANNGTITTKVKCYALESLKGLAWYCHNSYRKTHPVASKTPNAWGLYDMHGNVREWVGDLYGNYPEGPITDPTGSESGFQRIIRGGSYDSFARDCRSAIRLRYPDGVFRENIGFRLVMIEPPAGYVPPEDPVEPPEEPVKPVPSLTDPEQESVTIKIGDYNVTITWKKDK